MKKYSSLITAILMLLAGILLIVCKSSVLSWAITIIGVLLIVMSVIDLIDHNYTMFVVRAVLGILLIVLGWTLVSVLFWVFGAILLVYGILQLVNYIRSGTKVGSFVGFMAVYSSSKCQRRDYTVPGLYSSSRRRNSHEILQSILDFS